MFSFDPPYFFGDCPVVWSHSFDTLSLLFDDLFQCHKHSLVGRSFPRPYVLILFYWSPFVFQSGAGYSFPAIPAFQYVRAVGNVSPYELVRTIPIYLSDREGCFLPTRIFIVDATTFQNCREWIMNTGSQLFSFSIGGPLPPGVFAGKSN